MMAYTQHFTPPDLEAEGWLTIREASERSLLGVGVIKAQVYGKAPHIRSQRVGGRVYVLVADVEAWANRVTAKEAQARHSQRPAPARFTGAMALAAAARWGTGEAA